jgi:hypothetical protein
MDDRRKLVKLSSRANVYALDSDGRRLGPVREIGVGGLLIETTRQFLIGSPHHVTVVDESERIRREFVVVTRSCGAAGAVLQFRAMDIESAVEIGIIIGKYGTAAVYAASA